MRSVISALLVVAPLVCVAACAQSVDDETASSGTRVIVDTDMGVDDVRALMFLLEHPDVEVVAISVAGTGLGRCPQSAHNASAIVDALGIDEIPVGCGTRQPRDGFNTYPTALRDAAADLPGMNFPASSAEVPDAVDVLADAVASAETPVTLLTLGPLTNVAAFLDRNPRLSNIEEVRMMGGAVDVGGNIISFSNFEAEFNIWIDPVAAQRVLESEVAITLIPLDATNSVPLTPAFAEALRSGPSTPASELLLGNLDASPDLTGLYHWDDLAAATLVDETLVSYENIALAIDDDVDSSTAGWTRRTVGGRIVQVAVEADRASFEQVFFGAITGVLGQTDGLWEPDAVIRFDGSECSYDGPDPLPASLDVRIENTSDEPGLGVVFGTYSESATARDIESMIESGFSAPPAFFSVQAVASLPARTTSFANPTELTNESTIWCAVNNDVVELAGPKLRTE